MNSRFFKKKTQIVFCIFFHCYDAIETHAPFQKLKVKKDNYTHFVLLGGDRKHISKNKNYTWYMQEFNSDMRSF